MDKKTVRFSELVGPLIVGHRAFVYPVNHPDARLNGRLAHTSRVVAIRSPDALIRFETENSMYVESPEML